MKNFSEDYSFIPGPSMYIQKEHALAEAGFKTAFLGKKTLVVCDEFIKKEFYPQLKASLTSSFIEQEVFIFGGECTYEESGRIYDFAKAGNFDYLIGMGGGKALFDGVAVSRTIHP